MPRPLLRGRAHRQPFRIRVASLLRLLELARNPVVGGMTMPDAELATALKEANVRKLSFAFIYKGGDGKLIASRVEISPKQIAEAQRALGGGFVIAGKCFGPIRNMVFQVAKEAPAALGPALKKTVQRDTGLPISPHV